MTPSQGVILRSQLPLARRDSRTSIGKRHRKDFVVGVRLRPRTPFRPPCPGTGEALVGVSASVDEHQQVTIAHLRHPPVQFREVRRAVDEGSDHVALGPGRATGMAGVQSARGVSAFGRGQEPPRQKPLRRRHIRSSGLSINRSRAVWRLARAPSGWAFHGSRFGSAKGPYAPGGLRGPVKLGCGQQHKKHSPCRATPVK